MSLKKKKSSTALRVKIKKQKNKNKKMLDCEIERMRSSTFADLFPLNIRARGSWESWSQPADQPGLFLMKPLHTFSAGHYSGLTVHNGSCCSAAATCDDSKLVEYQPDPVGVLEAQSPQKEQDDNVPTGVHCSLTEASGVKMKLIGKSGISPAWNRRDYCADCTNTLSHSSFLL